MRSISVILTICVLAGCACIAGPGVCAPTGYVEHVSNALDALASGDTRASLERLEQAMACNANDPLAHTALGLTLLAGGRVDDAAAEFGVAIALDPSFAEAAYGLGLASLAKARTTEAAARFRRAQAAGPNLDMGSALDYCAFVATGARAPGTGSDELARAINALALTRDHRWAEAAPVWKELDEAAGRPSAAELPGCAATFIKARPAATSGQAIGRPYRSVLAAGSKLPTVTGRVTLNADLTKAGSVNIVVFYVDSALVGMTNHPPFNYSWNSTAVANGAHTIRIEGSDADGNPVSEKSMQVLVNNIGTNPPSSLVRTSEASALRARLWKLLRLRPSMAAVNYNLALCAVGLHDRESETAALERTVAADPAYADAAHRLARLLGRAVAPAKLVKGRGGAKIIALTFDDGPRPDTARLLDVLKDKDVRATFFVVGRQVEAYPDLVRRAANEGHEIENHTYGHRALEFLSEGQITQEIFRTAAAVRWVTGSSPRLLRAPGGREGKALARVAARFGITTVDWTTNCTSVEGTTKEKLVDYAVSTARPGAIILMHNPDGVTLRAIPEIIDALRKRGYRFVTASQMAAL